MVLLAFIFIPVAIGLAFGLAAVRGGSEQRPEFNGAAVVRPLDPVSRIAFAAGAPRRAGLALGAVLYAAESGLSISSLTRIDAALSELALFTHGVNRIGPRTLQVRLRPRPETAAA